MKHWIMPVSHLRGRDTHLVVVSRQGGIPTRTRWFLVNVEPDGESGTALQVTQLVVLPADIAPGATVPDPSGRWLVLMAHAAAGAGGRDVLMLCTVELRPGGTFREIADLASAQRAPTTAVIAWAPTARASQRAVWRWWLRYQPTPQVGADCSTCSAPSAHRRRRPGCLLSTCIDPVILGAGREAFHVREAKNGLDRTVVLGPTATPRTVRELRTARRALGHLPAEHVTLRVGRDAGAELANYRADLNRRVWVRLEVVEPRRVR